MAIDTKEYSFEREIVAALTDEGGYTQGTPTHFDKQACVDTAELFAFIGATQVEQWSQLLKRHGGNPNVAQQKFVARLAKELDRLGTLRLLRDGVEDQGVRISLAYFKPASTLNSDLVKLYQKNRLTVTRQLRYSPRHDNELDLCLFVNGIPVATAELKNPLTGQQVGDAIKQYQTDRDPADTLLGKRVLVHFAVDPYLVYMTGELALANTRFLPFNRGNNNGKGNPPVSDGYDTEYLWREIWSYDTWLDVLAKFVQQGRDNYGRAKGAPIFPRYHQWDAVTRLAADVLVRGTGHNYLVQHSAGSGKTNSIAWLAHRISTLHNQFDQRIFDKVVVITDRRILDEQLREKVEQFEKVVGTVISVTGRKDPKSEELAAALISPAKIVITTLQTFPFVHKKLGTDLAAKKFAIIVDEAHSSQTGEAADALKRALGAKASAARAESDDVDAIDPELAIAEILAARGPQPNMSMFAFTATPKERTLELFGERSPHGILRPFHLYSMRQAIEEGFIVDVLRNYITYETYYRVATRDPVIGEREVEVGKASAAIRRFVARNPDMIAQKAAIIVEHYRAHTAPKIGGHAKAMVVTDSRPAAVAYKRAIDAHIAEHHYPDVVAIVAFSGTVNDPIEGSVTESSLNGFPESQTALRFKGQDPYAPGDYQVLIVAEKFQTGFDEPLLHTMFVDKILTGLNAVQTLSRLNRFHPDKTETFVLDFRNDRDAIAKEFKKFQEETAALPTDVNAVYDARTRVYDLQLFDEGTVAETARIYFGADPAKRSLSLLYASLAEPRELFDVFDETARAEAKATIDSYVRLYAFMSQVMPDPEIGLEELYVFGRALLQVLPADADGSLQLGDELVLTHLRLDETSSGPIQIGAGPLAPGTAFPGGGQGGHSAAAVDRLSEVIDQINQRFGLNLDERDQLVFDQFEKTWLADQELRQVARNNAFEAFLLEFTRGFKQTVLHNEERNREVYDLIYGNSELAERILDFYARKVYTDLRSDN
jgi:type I restriction enzyme, R subunit